MGTFYFRLLRRHKTNPKRYTTRKAKRMMNNTAMFVIGFVIFAAYMWGYLSMISKANREQKERDQQK